MTAAAQTSAPTSQPAHQAFFSCRNMNAYYGDSFIVQNVSFDIEEGQILALLGRNGAGKTSTLRAIARATSPELRSGEVYLDGAVLHSMPNFMAARAGVQLVQEDRRIIPGLTVMENLELAQINGAPGWSYDRIFDLFPRLAERRSQEGTTMSGGEQQMLAIARALMSRPRLLLLDEPSLGLAPMVVRQIFQVIGEINRQDKMTILLVEQNAYHALRLAHRGYVMVNGQITLSGSGKELLSHPEVRSAYLEGGAGTAAETSA